jgi:hypothetical protein
VDKIAKAVTAALVAGYAVYEAVEGSGVTSGEWVKIVVFTLVAGLAVWAVPNTTEDSK